MKTESHMIEIARNSTKFTVHLPAATELQRIAAERSIDVLDHIFQHNWTALGLAHWSPEGEPVRGTWGRLSLTPIVHGDWDGPSGIVSDHHIVVVSHVSRLEDDAASRRAHNIEDAIFGAYLAVSLEHKRDALHRASPYQKLIWVECHQAIHVDRKREDMNLDSYFSRK